MRCTHVSVRKLYHSSGVLSAVPAAVSFPASANARHHKTHIMQL
jgi:hypothetical protein